MITFLIILLTLYILYKALPWLLAWWVRRQHRKYQQQVGEAYERATREQQDEERARRRESDIGDFAEDAEYQEIVGPREPVIEETFTAEEQVIDAEFEDI